MKLDILGRHHPGQVLLKNYLEPLGMDTNEFANLSGIPSYDLWLLIGGVIKVTPVMAHRLGIATETTPSLWIDLQALRDGAPPLAVRKGEGPCKVRI